MSTPGFLIILFLCSFLFKVYFSSKSMITGTMTALLKQTDKKNALCENIWATEVFRQYVGKPSTWNETLSISSSRLYSRLLNALNCSISASADVHLTFLSPHQVKIHMIAGNWSTDGAIIGANPLERVRRTVLTNQRGEELGGGAPSCHEGCPSNILTELEVLEDN